MPKFITVAKVGSIADGRAAVFTVDEKLIAVFREGNNYYAINDLCPHMGASLAEGHFQSGVITCPWHAWRFCVYDGSWQDNLRIKTDSYQVRVLGDQIQVCLSAAPGDE